MEEALEVVEENKFNLNLRQLYKYLGLSTSHYTRWAQNLLKPYTEGVEYVIEKGADPNGPKNKVEYFLRPEIAAIIMDKYDIDKKDVLYVLSLSPSKIVQKMVKNNGIEYYAFTMTSVKRIVSSLRDIPEGFLMVSECRVATSALSEYGFVDEHGNVTEKGKGKLLYRPIIGARDITAHYIIREDVPILIREEKKLLEQAEKLEQRSICMEPYDL